MSFSSRIEKDCAVMLLQKPAGQAYCFVSYYTEYSFKRTKQQTTVVL